MAATKGESIFLVNKHVKIIKENVTLLVKVMVNLYKAFLFILCLNFWFSALFYLIFGWIGFGVALSFGFLMSLGAWFFGDLMLIKLSRAVPVGVRGPDISETVKRLSLLAEIEQPRLYLSPEMAPNLYAVGRGPRSSSSLVITKGLLSALNDLELEAVVSYGVVSIKKRVVLPGTLVGASLLFILGGVWIFELALKRILQAFRLQSKIETWPLFGEVLSVVLMIPLVSLVFPRFFIKEKSVLEIDREASELIGDPTVLAHALRKIKVGCNRVSSGSSIAVSHLQIYSKPRLLFDIVGKSVQAPIQTRIANLKKTP